MTVFNNCKDLNKELQNRIRDIGLRYQVGGEGSLDAEYAIIGEGPGQQEINAELPFVGGAGNLLWNHLRTHRLFRTQFYTTNVCKRQISLAANTRYPVSADEWTKWKYLLQWELEQLPNLRYILAFGNAANEALFGNKDITKFRGSIYSYKDKSVLLTFNPAAVIREPKNEIVLAMDLRRFKTLVDGDFKEYKITKHINPSFDDAIEWIDKLKKEDEPISFDIETISNETACFGLGNSAQEAMCINLRNRITNRYSIEQEIKLLQQLQNLFDLKPVIAQNGNFDAHWCGYKDLLNIKVSFDTMLAHHTLYPLLPHNLGFLTSQYTTHPFYKDDSKEWREGGDIDSFWNYNATDVAITWECARRLKQELISQDMYDFFTNHVMVLDPHLVRSTIDGFLVDTKSKQKIADAIYKDVLSVEAEFHMLVKKELDGTYNPINIRSNPQIKNLFINKLKVKSPTGSVDKTTRQKLLDDPRTGQAVKDIIIKYDTYQREAKFFSTYADMRVNPDNRFRPTWKQQGVVKAPGRLSSTGNLWGTAANAQNQPQRAQAFYISDPDTVIIYIDGSQAEARVVAYLADIEKWKQDFERARLEPGSFDAHCSLAADMYKIDYNNVPTDDWITDPDTGLLIPTIRYKAKRARHGLNYRMNWPRLAETANLSLYEAKKTYILYHNTNPQIKEWWTELERVAKKKRELFTPLGRRFKIMQRIDENALESIVAFVPQATIGDHVKRCWYQCHEDERWDMNKARIKLNVHDALIGIATPDFAHRALSIMKEKMEQPIFIEDVYKRKVEPCIIPGDVAMSEADETGLHRWSNIKKLKGFGI